MNQRRDPAETGWLGFLYRNWRPTALGALVSRYWAWQAARGRAPDVVVSLRIEDRTSGRVTERAMVPCDVDGRRYLVSMLGRASTWVAEARKPGAAVFLVRGTRMQVRLVEVPVADRAPILKAWCAIATSGRIHMPVPYDAPLAEFAAIAADYPVFRAEPVAADQEG